MEFLIYLLRRCLAFWLDRGAFTHDLTDQRTKFIENIRSKK